ncbi:ABC transporter permease [Zunongwangia sp.]|uniref:ABC transporter permease n=1 Tax=Zunongwangia sp. TaxID=1965325 RepID=UPI003AA98841
MLKNYIKIAWRNIWKNKLIAGINIMGLATGIASVLLIALYITNELSYDNFYANKDLLYRVGFQFKETTKEGSYLEDNPYFVPSFAPDVSKTFPEIESFCRFSPNHEAFLIHNNTHIKSTNLAFADSSFFELFSSKFLRGNPKTALKAPYSMVLTQPLARKIFNTTDVLGKMIQLNGEKEYTITGVVAETPANSDIQFQALLSFSTLYKEPDRYSMGWNGGNNYISYVKLQKNAKAKVLQQKLPDFLWEKINKDWETLGAKVTAKLQPINKVHLYYTANSKNTRTNIYVFSIVALLILLISSVNFINLITAQAVSRLKEIGVRKVIGASRKQLVFQFLSESFLIALFAFSFGVCLFYLFIPLYSSVLGENLTFTHDTFFYISLLSLFLIIIIGLGAGSYIAFYLSSLNAAKAFKTTHIKHSKGYKKNLLIIQFTITAILITCTIVVNLQLQYAKNKSLGFDKDHIIILPLTGDKAQQAASLLKNEIVQFTGVSSVTALSQVPHDGITENGFIPENSETSIMIHQLDADVDLLSTFHFKLKKGEYYSSDKPSLSRGYIINETLAKQLGWKEPIGKTISRDGNHKIIGVVNDFIFSSLHDKVEPLIITSHPWRNQFNYLAIRYTTNNPSVLLRSIQEKWKNMGIETPFEYSFLDDAYNHLYKNEKRFQTLFFCFSLLSIVLSISGIFALVTLTLNQNIKEIGVRKVLGARIVDIINLTGKRYLVLVVIASLIAIPISWYYAQYWLNNFAYQIQLKWWMFIISGSVIFLVVFVITALQTIRFAIVNPVKSLRTE